MKWLLFLKYILYAKTKAFVGFFTGSVILWFPLLFADINIKNWGLVFVVKAAGAIGLAFCTGLAGALGKEAVDYMKKYPDKAPRWVKWLRNRFKKKLKIEKEMEKPDLDEWKNNGTYN